jgi:DNA mismatch repair ATPase MutL
MSSRNYDSSGGSLRDQFTGVPSSRIVEGAAVKLDEAVAQSIKERAEAKSIQEELKSIKPVTSPFSELFFDDAPAVSDSLAAEQIVESKVCFEDAFLYSLSEPLVDGGGVNTTFEDEMDIDEPISMNWTRQRIHTTSVSTLSEASSSGNERINLTKEMLAEAQVIGQVEDKFIIIKTQGKLCVVDQHAADERVALEKLENALFNTDMSETTRIELTKKHLLVGDIVKATSVMPAKRVALTTSQVQVAMHQRDVLEKWHFTFKPSNDESVLLIGVPSICGRVADVNDFTEFIDELSQTAGEQVKPECVKRILASQACRYAIMFGDKLSEKQCRELISNLSKCSLAFQCAHGRPSVIPLVDLDETKRSEIQTDGTIANARVSSNKLNIPSSSPSTKSYYLRGPKRVIRRDLDRLVK